MEFYTRRGWSRKALYKDAVSEARRLKPELPHLGHNGIPIRDEIEFEFFV